MSSRRISRLNEQLKREIVRILQEEVKDPRIGFVTITGVDVSADLSVAKVYVSVMGEDEDKEASLEGLRTAAPFIRGELGRRLHLRRAPELNFRLDRSLEHAMRVEELLKEVLPEDEAEEGTDGDTDATETDEASGEA